MAGNDNSDGKPIEGWERSDEADRTVEWERSEETGFAEEAKFPFLKPLFHEKNILELENYLSAFDALSEKHRFAILYLLHDQGELGAREIGEAIGKSGNGLHHHLDTLSEAGLIDNKRRETRDENNLQSYYRMSLFGSILADRIFAVIQREKEILDRHATSDSSIEQDGLDTGLEAEIQTLLQSDDSSDRRFAIGTLSKLSEINPEAVQPLLTLVIDLLREDNHQIRLDAALTIRSLAEEHPDAVPSRVNSVLQDVYQEIRESEQNVANYREFVSVGCDIHSELEVAEGVASAYHTLAVLGQGSDEIEAAAVREHFEESYQIYLDIDDIEAAARVGLEFANFLGKIDREPEAREYFQQLHEMRDRIESGWLRLRIRFSLGYVEYQFEQYDVAEELLKDTLEIAREQDDLDVEAYALQTLGLIKQEQQDFEAAERFYRMAIDRFEELDDFYHAAASKAYLASLANQQDQYTRAQEFLEDAIESVESTDDQYFQAALHYSLGSLHQDYEEFEAAINSFEDTLEYDLSDPEIQLQSVNKVVSMYEELGEREIAIEWCQTGIELVESAENDYQNWCHKFRINEARLTESTENMRELYATGLQLISKGERTDALSLLGGIWNQHEAIDTQEIQSVIYSAGATVAGLLGVIEVQETELAQDEILEQIDEQVALLSDSATILYEQLTSNQEPKDVSHLFSEITVSDDDEIQYLEIEVHQELLREMRDHTGDDTPMHEFMERTVTPA